MRSTASFGPFATTRSLPGSNNRSIPKALSDRKKAIFARGDSKPIVQAKKIIPKSLRLLRLHPSLIFDIPKGKIGITRKHAAVEIEKARRLYEYFHDMSLSELFTRFDDELCVNYKGCFLYAMVRKKRPQVVVETGVASGVSSYSILQALHDNSQGSLYSIDLPNASLPLPEGQETGFLVPDSLRGRWTLLLGDSKQELPELLRELGTIDFFVHDSLHEYSHMMFEYKEAWPRLGRSGTLFSDDVSYTTAFQDFCRENNTQGTIMERREEGYSIKVGWVEKQ